MKWLVETEMEKKFKKTVVLKREEHEDDSTPNQPNHPKAAVIVTQT